MRRNWIKYLNIFLGILTAFFVVNVFLFLRAYEKERAETSALPVSPAQPSAVKTEKSLTDYAVIYRRNLFNVQEAPRVATSSVQPASLKLKGTVVGAEEFTFCIIEDRSKRKDDLYQKGDKIQDMEVSEITDNSVVLIRGTEKMVLYIDESAKDIKTNETAVAAERPTLADFSSLENPEPNTWVLSREDVLAATRNISQIMSDFKIKPNFSAGKMDGFRIDDINEGSIALAMGIKKGDIVKKINGETIDSPKKIFEFYRNLENSASIQLEVSRGDATETLTYEIKQ
ncbi:MAG: type II secretion system protein N [Candidatus Ratteibacteria bacterium]|nr:type II secretion system protein N [Candidatus Ratteibacteria bacterium]